MAGIERGTASPTFYFRDGVIRTILFYAGFLLIIILFSEECARALQRLRRVHTHSRRYRLIIYPLLMLLLAAAGIIIAASLINFSTRITFSYD